MKILFTRFPLESAYGGAEFQTLSLMKGLAERGHAVAFLGSCPVLLDLCQKEGILNAHLEIGPPPVTKWSALSFAWRKQKMQRLLESALAEFGSLDAVCMLSMSEKILLTPFAAQRGIKPVWIEHDRIGRWLSGNPWLGAMKTQTVHATTVAVSKLTKKNYLELGWPEERVVDIVNGVDESRVTSHESREMKGSKLKTQDSKLSLGCVARLSKDKGVDLLLEAVGELTDIDVTIVGQGKEAGEIRKRAKRLNESAGRERITILPKADDIGAFYRSVDALVLPSPVQDPCPLAPMEALWVGTPVILTDACGTAGYLEDGKEALVTKAGSVAALEEAILTMKNPEIRARLAEAGQAAARQRFSLERMIDDYVALFSQTQDRK